MTLGLSLCQVALETLPGAAFQVLPERCATASLQAGGDEGCAVSTGKLSTLVDGNGGAQALG